MTEIAGGAEAAKKSEDAPPMVSVENLVKSFGKQKVLDNLNLNCERAKTTVIIGKSGEGKSVLLKHIIRLLEPDEGKIVVDGEDITHAGERRLNDVRKKFGMLFQDAALLDSMSVGENVGFPLEEHTDMPHSEIRDKVEENLRMVGLRDVQKKFPSQLSGGMRKRVGLARAIITRPKIILFDEPTTGLDPIMTDVIDSLIADLQSELLTTNIVISHDIKASFKLGHKIAMLYKGRIIVEGPPDEVLANDDPALRQFLEGRKEGPIEVI